MTRDELEVFARLTVDLTQLRQNECKHLCVENLGPEIFVRLVYEYEHRRMIYDPRYVRSIEQLGE